MLTLFTLTHTRVLLTSSSNLTHSNIHLSCLFSLTSDRMEDDGCHGHSHDHMDHDDGLGLSLRPLIDMPGVTCLNESIPHAGRSILKLHEERLTVEPALVSHDDDPELLLYIPFTEATTVSFLSIRSQDGEGAGGAGAGVPTAPPRRIKLFANRDNLDFETARELQPSAELELVPPQHFAEGTIDYPLRPAGRFQNIASLTIFIVDNFAASVNNGDEDDEEGGVSTLITYVGLKGRGSRQKRQCVETVYESQGMRKDHQVRGGEFGSHQLL